MTRLFDIGEGARRLGAGLSQFWDGRAGRRLRHAIAIGVRVAFRLADALLWGLRVAWARINPRTRVFLIILGLALLGGSTSRLSPSFSNTAQALAVLLVALIGFWWIVTAPVRSRRWW